MAQCPVKNLELKRDSAKFHVLWQRIANIAARLNMEPAGRNSVARQQHCANPPVEDIKAL